MARRLLQDDQQEQGGSRKPHQQQPHTPARTKPHDAGSLVFEKWVRLLDQVGVLKRDADELQKEVKHCDAKVAALAHSNRMRLPIDAALLDAKLQTLHDVLGADQFAGYMRDLYAEVGRLRTQWKLYGDPLDHLRRYLLPATSTTGFHELVAQKYDCHALHRDFPLVAGHCTAATDPDQVDVALFGALVASLPPAREQLLGLVFRRVCEGATAAATPHRHDTHTTTANAVYKRLRVRPHRLRALVKASFAALHASYDELLHVTTWLQKEMGIAATQDAEDEEEGEDHHAAATAIDFQRFALFHLQASDGLPEQDDAAFIALLTRWWQLDVPDVGNDAIISHSINHNSSSMESSLAGVVRSHDARVQHQVLSERKQALLAKLDHAVQSANLKLLQLEPDVHEIRTLVVQKATLALLADGSLAAQTACHLVLLTQLSLEAQCLHHLPESLGLLVSLVDLRLGHNLLPQLPASIGGLQHLERLEADQ